MTLDGTNYNDWMRNIKIPLRYKGKEYALEKQVVEIDEATASPKEIATYKKHYDDTTKVACHMVATVIPKLQKFYEDYRSYEMNLDIVEKFHN